MTFLFSEPPIASENFVQKRYDLDDDALLDQLVTLSKWNWRTISIPANTGELSFEDVAEAMRCVTDMPREHLTAVRDRDPDKLDRYATWEVE